MLKNFVFPDLEPDSEKTAGGDNVPSAAQETAPAEAADPGARQVTLPAAIDGIDISEFPAMRSAYGLVSEPAESVGDKPLSIDDELDALFDEPETAASEPEPEEPVEKEEPIPSLFAGIGRTDWSTPPPEPELPGILDFFDIPDDAVYVSPDEPQDEEAPDGEPEEKEPELNEYDLLDLIDDIEFSDLGAEALKPVRIKQPSADPYYTSFNAGNEESDEPDEFPIVQKYRFEKK